MFNRNRFIFISDYNPIIARISENFHRKCKENQKKFAFFRFGAKQAPGFFAAWPPHALAHSHLCEQLFIGTPMISQSSLRQYAPFKVPYWAVRFFVSVYRLSAANLTIDKRKLCAITENLQARRCLEWCGVALNKHNNRGWYLERLTQAFYIFSPRALHLH